MSEETGTLEQLPAPAPRPQLPPPHGPEHDGREGDGEGEPPRGTALYIVGVLVVIACALGATWLAFGHRRHEGGERHERDETLSRGPLVQVARATVASGMREVTLPGDVRPFRSTAVYARVAGYVERLLVERGDLVRENQVLAVLQSPETTAQVRSAEAELTLRNSIAARSHRLVEQRLIAPQDDETAAAQAAQARQSLSQAQAQRGYTYVRAPFAGTVTARYADPGALLPAATGSTQSALPLVDLADIERLRVLIYVGQDVAAGVRPGTNVVLHTDASGGSRDIPATVTLTAGVLDPRTRTMACEVHLDNREHRVMPGSFVRVTVRVPASALPTVPGDALFMRGDQLMAAIVENGRVRFSRVEIATDDGRNTQVTSGVRGGDTVVVHVPGELVDGARVRAAPREATANAGSAVASGSQGSGPMQPAADSTADSGTRRP